VTAESVTLLAARVVDWLGYGVVQPMAADPENVASAVIAVNAVAVVDVVADAADADDADDDTGSVADVEVALLAVAAHVVPLPPS